MYTYDADGRRSSKQTADGLRYYVWDGDQLAVTIAPGSDPFFALTLSASGKEEDVALTLSVGTTYYAKVNGTVYSAVATHNSGQADLSRGRWDDTEIPEVPPDPKPETFTELEIGGFWFSISDKTGRGTVYGPGGKTIELYTGNPVSLLPTVSYVRGLSLVAAVRDGVRTYYHYNAHGDVVQLTNSSGTVTKNYTYDAFGVEKNAAASDANPFRYCGEQFDSETGNYYLRARYYTPGIGRFTQADTHWNPGNMIYGDEPQKWNEWQGEEDPLNLHAYTYKPEATAVAQAGNLYAYCGGNPLKYKDYAGHAFVIDDVLIVGGTIFVGGVVYTGARTALDSPQGKQFVNNASKAISDGLDALGTQIVKTVTDGIENVAQILQAEHKKNARPSTKNKHQEGQRRQNMDKGGEKGDIRRRPNPNKRRH